MTRARIRRVQSWESTSGQVLSSKVVVRRGSESDNVYAEYEVTYSVKGSPYRAHFESWSSSPVMGQEKAARHPPGSAARIYHDPANPRTVDPDLEMNPATLSLPAWALGSGLSLFLSGLVLALLGGSRPQGDL
jgi:hypothetical protein